MSSSPLKDSRRWRIPSPVRLALSPGTVVVLSWDERNDPQRAARATSNFEWGRDHYGPSARQLVEID